jgi:hypothetical protein
VVACSFQQLHSTCSVGCCVARWPPSTSQLAPPPLFTPLRLLVVASDYITLSGALASPPPLIIPPPLVAPLLFGWLSHCVAWRPGLSPPLGMLPPGKLASHHTIASHCAVAPPLFSWLSCCPMPWPPSPSHCILLFWLVVALRSLGHRPPSPSHCTPLLRLVVTTRCPVPWLPSPSHHTSASCCAPLIQLVVAWRCPMPWPPSSSHHASARSVDLSSCCSLLFVVVLVVVASLPALPEEERMETRKRPPALVDC